MSNHRSTQTTVLSAVPSEEEHVILLERIARGERAAFDVFYRAYFRRLERFLNNTLSRSQLVDEVLDDTMLVVWQKAASFDGSSRVSTWVFGIAHNKARKALERERRHGSDRLPPDDEPSDRDHHPDPQLGMMASQLRLGVLQQLASLPKEQRAVVELTYYHGFAYKEIAQIVGCPVDTVKTRMFHARRKLRSMLLALGPGSR